MKLTILCLTTLALLTGCAVDFTTPKGTRVRIGFSPSPDQIEALAGLAK